MKIEITVASGDHTQKREFQTGPIRLKQARAIGIGVMKGAQSPDMVFAASLDQAAAIISAALSFKHPEVTPEWLMENAADWHEIRRVADEILVETGFAKREGAPSGEAKPESTGPQ